jgi:hypothetical protein
VVSERTDSAVCLKGLLSVRDYARNQEYNREHRSLERDLIRSGRRKVENKGMSGWGGI